MSRCYVCVVDERDPPPPEYWFHHTPAQPSLTWIIQKRMVHLFYEDSVIYYSGFRVVGRIVPDANPPRRRVKKKVKVPSVRIYV